MVSRSLARLFGEVGGSGEGDWLTGRGALIGRLVGR